MSSNLKLRIQDTIAAWTGKGRAEPFDPDYRDKILDLTSARNAIWAEQDPTIRAFLLFALSHTEKAKSQIFQDALVLWVLNSKREGFFVEFGATNGVSLSNSNMLETHFGWTGILAEPARNWHADLRANRPGAAIETDCVWERTGDTLSFSESNRGELSTLTDFTDTDDHARRRKGAATYDVKTISLNDMLTKHNAPQNFDYLSIDTEGSELAILTAFDFAKWQPKVVTVEHNYTLARHDLHTLLTNAGYTRVLEKVSIFDDWYLAPGVTLPV